ncbi:lantibiotic dehydratase [Nonomuraea rubra]
MGSSLLFRPTGLALARVTTYPGDLELPELLDSGEPADPAWLNRIWARPDVRAAITVATPELAEQTSQALTSGNPARQARISMAVASYLLRWQRRAVPFGLFAGVAPVEVGRVVTAAIGTQHQVVLRADAQWLNALVDHLEAHPAALPRLRVTTNSMIMVRGGRAVIPARPGDGTDPGPSREVSIRHLPPIRKALAAATTPIAFRELADQLTAEFPGTPPGTVATTLTALVHQGFLLTSLRPPSTIQDGLPFVLDQLRAAAGDAPDLAPTLTALADLHRDLSARRAIVDLADIASLTTRMRALCTGGDRMLAADTAADATIALPRAVLDEAAKAASALLRLTNRPFGAEVWRDYHLRFRRHYGPGAAVPVRELLADSGLGMPAGFLGSSHGRPARGMPDRDAKLLALVQEATVDGRDEIVLSEQDISSLTVADDPAEMVIPRRVELGFELHAETAHLLERGRFRLWVYATPRPQSSMAGRFAHLFPQPAVEQLIASYEPPDEEVATAQLSFSPRLRSTENVVRVPQLLPAVIPLTEHPAPGTPVIGLDDLAVTADSTQMYLVRLSTGQRVIPQALHALEASAHTPALARFLTGVATARHAIYGPIDFGVASMLPYLPRIRYGRTVLAAARWILPASALAGPREPLPLWEKALSDWRDRWRVPSAVVLHQNGQRLPLDLDSRLDCVLLRRSLNRAHRVELHEGSRAPEAWVGRPCEFLVVLTANESAGRLPRVPAVVQRPTATVMPGAGDLIHARLLGHPDRYDEILAHHLGCLLDSLGPLRWWFRRYRDTLRPDSVQELWLYLQLTDAGQYSTAASYLADFASDLQSQNLLATLSLHAYQPQTGRYGPGKAMAAAHRVAAADSAVALAQIKMAAFAKLPGQALAAASMADLAAGLATSDEGYGWLVNQLPRQYGELDRALQDTTSRLADALNDDQALRAHPGGTAVADAWALRRAALHDYHAQLGRHDYLPITVLRSLLHDHHVRALGVDPAAEAVTNRLARAAALRLLTMNKEATS